MEKRYGLEIYEPGSIEDIWVTLESDTPFMAFNEGDIINSKMFPSLRPNYEEKILRIVRLEHFLWEASGIVKHKIGVVTEAVKDSVEERFAKKPVGGSGLVH